MTRFIRAGGLATAALMLAATFGFAAPSQALDVPAAPITSAYIDHALATVDASALAANEAGTAKVLAHDVDFSTPVTEHAIAKLAETPAEKDPSRSLASLISDYAGAEVVDEQHECLAGAVYFESKGEPLEGQLAVAEVILNRANSGRFPTSICGVVKQKSQFSFVRGGRIPPAPRSSEAWRKAVAIAHIAQKDLADSAGSKAMFFHARYVSPAWRGLTRIASLGNHIFYR